MNATRFILPFLLVAVIAFSSCRSQKMATYEPTPPVQEVVYEPVREPVSEPVPEPVVPEPVIDIPVRTERFTFERVEQEVAHGYFVIVGSFSNPDNAERARAILTRQGFSPFILISETGMNRVCINSYSLESEARARVQQIRNTFPEYHDTWLLIRQR